MKLRRRSDAEPTVGERAPVDDVDEAAEPEADGEEFFEPEFMARKKRPRQDPPRGRRVFLRLSEQEYDEIARAATHHGRTPTGYAAEAAVRAAQATNQQHDGTGVDAAGAPVGSLREALVQLMQARVQVRRVGVNLNQAVLMLNATGDTPPNLLAAIERADAVVAELDARATELARRIRAER